MSEVSPDPVPFHLQSPSGLRAQLNANGALRRFDCDPAVLTLFVGNEMEGGPTNVYLRRHSGAQTIEWTPLLGPLSPTRFEMLSTGALQGHGTWRGIDYWISLQFAREATAWFWHVRLENSTSAAQHLDLTYAQDLALAAYGGIRLNEYYVSQYIDHTALSHPKVGVVIASRQNLSLDGRHPWSVIGSLRGCSEFATDAMQFHGLATRAGDSPVGLTSSLPSRRLQQEHSMVIVRDLPIRLEPQHGINAGFFGRYLADHPNATSTADLEQIAQTLALAEGAPSPFAPRSVVSAAAVAPDSATLFSSAAVLKVLDFDEDALQTMFGSHWRHLEVCENARPLSFFHGSNSHVVLPAKELRVQRPHGHLLRTGRHMTPDETALTSTAWMAGVFHSMVTQGHVSINRFLSTVHSYLGLFRSHGQRVFAQIGGSWRLLDVPSVFEMSPDACLWIYRHETGVIRVKATAVGDTHELRLSIDVTAGGPTRFLISHHVALNGDDGSVPGAALWKQDGDSIVVVPAPGSELGSRFPDGSFRITPDNGTPLDKIGGDELLFIDGRSRQQPFLCILTQATFSVNLSIRGYLLAPDASQPVRVAPGQDLVPTLAMNVGRASPLAAELSRLADIAPWFTQNAFVHYLSPRGLEQYSGGGWGTRDVCQGPVEMLLALGRIEPIRDLLLRVLAAQNPDGDWPQWFMFFDRERNIRPGDSHGDIVLWPILVLAQYLTASGDSGLLDERVRFFDSRGAQAGEEATVWQHAQRALAVIEKRVIPGTMLAAYGHGDWNDSLQPADPSLRERMCSAWTVTLHYQTLMELAKALRTVDRTDEAVRLETWAAAVKADFQRLLVKDAVLTGYAHFEAAGVRYLLHPSDNTTGVHYSGLAMFHAILEDLLTPAQAQEHLKLIQTHLSAPDGVRLFDRPLPYHGGPERLFQRAESATYFGREIGLMYTHAHLRYAQALAHVGEPERFFHALCQANPIEIRTIVPTATLRQANCYYSSSDAAFADRYQASEEYDRVVSGTIALDGGWRVYSSGAGIALGLIIRRFLGLSCESATLRVDPVIPAALDGMQVSITLLGHRLQVHYRIGPAGCGVNSITLNDQPVPFASEPNPHRRGAALAPLGAFSARLGTTQNILKIDIG